MHRITRFFVASVGAIALVSGAGGQAAEAETACGNAHVLQVDLWLLTECTTCPSGLDVGPVGQEPFASVYACVNP